MNLWTTRVGIFRSRLWYAGWIGLVMAMGLLLRSSFQDWPRWVTKYGGDALWALLVFLGLGFWFYRLGTCKVAVWALAGATLAELTQLYHAPWIDAIRSARLGHLVLGSTFNPPDLFAYAVGISGGAWLEWAYYRGLGKASRHC